MKKPGYEVVSRRWDAANTEMTETYAFPNKWGLEVVTNLSNGVADASASVHLLKIDPDAIISVGIPATGDDVPPAQDPETAWLWFGKHGELPDWLTLEGLWLLCGEVAALPNRVVDLGPCEWFALCDRDATHMEAHPAFPGGVPACDRCVNIGR